MHLPLAVHAMKDTVLHAAPAVATAAQTAAACPAAHPFEWLVMLEVYFELFHCPGLLAAKLSVCDLAAAA